MGSKKSITTATDAVRRLRRKPSRRLAAKPEGRRRGDCGGASVSDKLEALKNLIPSEKDDGEEEEEIKPEQLFQETADYIVTLKTQVFVLQKLIDFYGSQQQPQENRSSV